MERLRSPRLAVERHGRVAVRAVGVHRDEEGAAGGEVEAAEGSGADLKGREHTWIRGEVKRCKAPRRPATNKRWVVSHAVHRCEERMERL